MRVTHALFLSERPGKHPFSGAENHLWILLPALVKDSVQVSLLILELNPGATLEAKYHELSAAGVSVTVLRRRSFSGNIGKFFATASLLARAFWYMRKRSRDVLHLHLDDIYLPALSVLAGMRSTVFSFHCDEPRYREPFFRRWYGTVGRRFKAFIGITDYVTNFCRDNLALPPEKMHRIYYGVPVPPTKPVVREQFGISPNKFVVGYVGRLTEQKNLKIFCEAAGAIPEIQAVLIGGGPEEEALRGFVKERNFSNIIFLGPQPDAASMMPLFDLLCLPSRWEGLGLVLVEAMLLGVPVLGSTAGAIPEVLDDGRLGTVVDCSEPEKLKEALESSMRQGRELRKSARSIVELARDRFSVQNMTKATVSLYRTLGA